MKIRRKPLWPRQMPAILWFGYTWFKVGRVDNCIELLTPTLYQFVAAVSAQMYHRTSTTTNTLIFIVSPWEFSYPALGRPRINPTFT